MIVYYSAMRTQDDEKKAALFEATVKLVNAIGFASSSVAKIAREAGVSPATIYVYYKNKEDLLVSTYVEIKQNLSRAVLEDFDPDLPIRDILRKAWIHTFNYICVNSGYYRYCEQFANSPYNELVDKKAVEQYFVPLIDVLQRGIEQKIIKNVGFDVLVAFMWYPIIVLANPRLSPEFELSEAGIDAAFTLAWDAVKL